jgi:hypothetical protein
LKRGSPAQIRARADLTEALIKAGRRFQPREEFNAWLGRNNCEHIEYRDPLRDIALRLHPDDWPNVGGRKALLKQKRG